MLKLSPHCVKIQPFYVEAWRASQASSTSQGFVTVQELYSWAYLGVKPNPVFR